MNYKELHERLVSSLSLPPERGKDRPRERGKATSCMPVIGARDCEDGKREEEGGGQKTGARAHSPARPPRSRSPLLFSSVSSHSLLPRALRGKVFRQPLSHLRVIQHSITYAPFCFWFFYFEARTPGSDVHVTTCLFRSPPGPAPRAGRESEVDNLSGLAGTASSSPEAFPARQRPPARLRRSLPPSGLQTWWARTLTVGGRLLELTQ